MKMKLKVIKHSELPFRNAWYLSPVCLRVVIKIAGVAVIAHFGDDGGFQLLVVDLFPVNRLEPSGNKTFLLAFCTDFLTNSGDYIFLYMGTANKSNKFQF